MHLLIITSSYPLSPEDTTAAAGLFVRDFAREMVAQGHKVTVLTQERPGDVRDDPELAIVRYPAPGVQGALVNLRLGSPRDLVAAVRTLSSGRRAARRLARQEHFDHILAMWAFPAGWYALSASRAAKVPYSVWALGSDILTLGRMPVMRRLIAHIVRRAKRCFADGYGLAETTAAIRRGACTFLPSSRHSDEGPTPEVEWLNEGPQFLYVGRLEPVKGPDVLIAAAAILRQRELEFGIVLIGDGSLRDSLAAEIARLKLDDYVQLLGHTDSATARAHLDECTALVIPSRSESIPLVFSEALRSGTPIVATDVGDMGALVNRYDLGAVAAPDDPTSLADALQTAMAELESWRNNAKALAPQFSLNGVVATFLEHIGGAERRQDAA